MAQGRHAEVSGFFELPLSEWERNGLAHFVGHELRADAALHHELLPLLAPNPAAQTYYFERFVDLAQLTTSYGEAVEAYLCHKLTPEAQTFGRCLRFLNALLRNDAAAASAALMQVRAVPATADMHAFPQGRRAYTELLAAHFLTAGPAPLLTTLIAQGRQVPHESALATDYPATYHLFPAGFHYYVAEGLFLTQRWNDLLDWHTETEIQYPELTNLSGNVFNELRRAFRAAALAQVGRKVEARNARAELQLTPLLITCEWFGDYYSALDWLAELATCPLLPRRSMLLENLIAFAERRQMPFFRILARQWDINRKAKSFRQ